MERMCIVTAIAIIINITWIRRVETTNKVENNMVAHNKDREINFTLRAIPLPSL